VVNFLRYIFYFCLFLLSICESFSQNVHSSFGIFGGLNYNFFSSNFSEIPGFSKPFAPFSASNELGIHGGLYYQLPISDRIYVLPRLSYFQSPSSLEAFEPTTFIVNGVPTPGVFKHSINAQFSTISLEGLLGYRLFSSFDLFGGASLGYYIGKTFTQEEEIFSPDTVRFLPGIRTRNPRSGDVPNSTLQGFAIGGGRYTFITSKYEIVPEIAYYFPLQNLSSSVDWKYSSLRVGLSFGTIFEKPIPIQKPIIQVFDTVFVRDTILKSTNSIQDNDVTVFQRVLNAKTNLTSLNENTNTDFYTVTVQLQYVRYKYEQSKKVEKVFTLQPDFIVSKDINGSEIVESSLIIYRKIQRTSSPLLPYIFFDVNSATLPNRYLQSSDINYSNKALQNYYAILPIIAERLKNNPKATLTVIGYVSKESEAENSSNLARNRAENVKSVLLSLGVSPSQLDVSSGLLPPKNARLDSEYGNAENRRVEFSSNDESILAPVLIETTQNSVEQTPLYLLPKKVEENIINQEFEIQFDDKTTIIPLKDLPVVSENTEFKAYKFPFELVPLEENWNKRNSKKMIKVSLRSSFEDSVNRKEKNIQFFFKDTSEIENEQLSVLLFDYDSSELTESMKKQLESYSKRDFSKKTIKFTGTTDVIGSQQYNKELSLKRAISISKVFNGTKEVVGFGTDDTTYDNTLPEGRFYSRTVKIEIR
jgi:outer membrane protein OmpA-like peptidoglycan-associated protein